ncbi:phage tail assembly chaperone [Muricomes intestini]|jgi:hypothetical protein|uniref:phage tail assembly chaperone n=1 Tax=Muricomes intestini TaxID=1796634 RepID=UPI002FDE3150
MEQDNTLEILLNMDVQSPREKSVKIKRLSEICGKDVIFRIRQLSYNRLHEIVEQHRNSGDISVFTVLTGVVSPNLKSKELMQKYNAVTPDDTLKRLLLPGEIEDLDWEIERLCGYRYNTLEEIEEIKKK